MTSATPIPDPHEPPRELLPLSQLVTLSIYWFGIVIIWGGLNKIILPAMIGRQPGGEENLGSLLAIIVTVGVFAPIIIQPTIGTISDYTVTRWGRRKPYIVIGTLLDLVFLFGLATSQTYVALVAFYFLLQLSSNAAQGPFQGYVPDLVPAKQVGLASGLMGTMIVLGTIAGVGIATAGVSFGTLFLATMALGAVELLTMVILVATVHEGTAGPRRTTSWLGVARSAWGTDILRQSSVLWLLLVRLLFLGAYAATSLALPYFQRAHGMSEADASATVFIGTAIVGVTTALAALPGARISDRVGRKPVIWVAALIAAIGLTGVALAPNPVLAIACFVPFGIGMGAFLSVDWALMTDVIPKHTSGRYMGILNAGTAMAEPVFLVVAGPLALDLVGRALGLEAGARAAMFVAVAFLGLAALALLRVDARRREREAAAPVPEGAPLPAGADL
jgi:MFS family permease